MNKGGHAKVEACRKIGFGEDLYKSIVNVPMSSMKAFLDITNSTTLKYSNAAGATDLAPQTMNDGTVEKKSAHQKATEEWENAGALADSLIIASKYLPKNIVKVLFPLF